MEKIIPIPDEEEEMENIEAELAEADFPITNFKKGGVFYHIIRMFVTLFIELKQLARTILNSCFILHAQGDWLEIKAADFSKSLKEAVKARGYDFLLMHEDLEYLEYCKVKVIEKLAEYGFEPNPKKTKVIPITEEILFLGFYYRLTETGKIIMRLNPANVKQERKKLYRLVAKAKKGESSKAKVDECFNGWKDHAAKGTSYQLLRRMEAYYKELWRNQDGISTDQNKRL